jgi:H+/Cl- antiporter ClcA
LPEPRSATLQQLLNTLHSCTRWLILAIFAGILAGSASALLLFLLEWATATREAHLWIIALLPLAGLAVGLMYHYLGRSVEAGNNLILEEVHAELRTPRAVIPARMTPLILIGTALTHLFGGSAGREGTAIQTGASLADQITHIIRLRYPFSERDRRILLMAGISAGFGSVFGTPLAGAFFGLEVLTVGALTYDAIFSCFLASFIADYVTHAWHIHHTIYTVTQTAPLTPVNLLYTIAAGIAFGLTALCFARSTHAIGAFFKRRVAYPPLRPFFGGLAVALCVLIPLHFGFPTTKYIGLGVPTIVAAFSQHLPRYDFAAKFAFTTLTLGAGFKGGEVTPLFYIGATLGNALSSILPLPSTLLAAMGFVAVFAGAANTPIASSLMALELFGPEAGAFAAIACVVSYLFSGPHGIYHAQRHATHKRPVLPAKVKPSHSQDLPAESTSAVASSTSATATPTP